MNKEAFLEKYNISEDDFNKTKLQWDNLMKIHDDFISMSEELQIVGDFISKCLNKVYAVHSIRQRIKNPEHLVEKIIRKKIDNPEREITLENYTEQITDLIGIRVIHLFKEDWENIHDFILNKWEIVEQPIAYIRKGDSDELSEKFTERGCKVKDHEYGYRSIHYTIKLQPNKRTFIAEIQVRTIFEEGWSEIDHRIRYPYDIDNEILADYLVIFNRLAGSADEMGSYVKFLADKLKDIEKCHVKELEEKNNIITELRDTINKLKIDSHDKETLQDKINILEKKMSVNDIKKINYNTSLFNYLTPEKIKLNDLYITSDKNKMPRPDNISGIMKIQKRNADDLYKKYFDK